MASVWWAPAYRDLRLAGRLANAIRPWGLLGAPVETVVRDPDETPYCDSSDDPDLDRVLRGEWPHDLVIDAATWAARLSWRPATNSGTRARRHDRVPSDAGNPSRIVTLDRRHERTPRLATSRPSLWTPMASCISAHFWGYASKASAGNDVLVSVWQRRGVLVLILLSLIAIPVVLLLMKDDGQDVATVLGVSLAVLSAILGYLAWQYPRSADDDPIQAAVVALAEAQRQQWTSEQHARQVLDPYPLPVRWNASGRASAVMASWASIRGVPAAAPIAVGGSYGEIADVFTHADSPRRLVILGDPGAGKSILVLHLTVELLRLRAANDPVPVLLSVAEWNPTEPLDDWIASRLAADYRSLARLVRGVSATQRSLARELVAMGKILPILDGLDEMALPHQATALASIGRAAAAGEQFVLTSRTSPFEAAVASCGPLPRTVVVEIEPLGMAEVAQYLVDGTDEPTPRWDTVTSHLVRSTNSPLSESLSTPLMAWLAQTVYRRRDTNPNELIAASWSNSRDGIEENLLGQLVPAAYSSAVGKYRPLSRNQSAQLQRQLIWLAKYLQLNHTYDLAWWDLWRAIPRRYSVAIVIGSFAVLIGTSPIVSPFVLSPWSGNVAGSVAVSAAIFMAGLPAKRTIKLAAVVFPVYWIVRTVMQLATIRNPDVGLGMGTLQGVYYVASGVLAGCVVATIASLANHKPQRISLRWKRLAIHVAVLAFAALSIVLLHALLYDLPTWFSFVLIFALTVLLAGFIVQAALSPSDHEQDAVTPHRLLAADRALRVLFTCLFGMLIGFFYLLVTLVGNEAPSRVLYGFEALIVCSITTMVASPWGRFCVLRVVLAASGRTPFRLMAFLREAYGRGILRQSGSVYQFRHNRLQDHLSRRGHL